MDTMSVPKGRDSACLPAPRALPTKKKPDQKNSADHLTFVFTKIDQSLRRLFPKLTQNPRMQDNTLLYHPDGSGSGQAALAIVLEDTKVEIRNFTGYWKRIIDEDEDGLKSRISSIVEMYS